MRKRKRYKKKNKKKHKGEKLIQTTTKIEIRMMWMRKGSTTNWPENLPGREKKIENLTIKNLMIITRRSYRHYSRLRFQPIECKYSDYFRFWSPWESHEFNFPSLTWAVLVICDICKRPFSELQLEQSANISR